MRLTLILCLAISYAAHAHSGCMHAKGCHASSQSDYYYTVSSRGEPEALARRHELLRNAKAESDYNRLFCKSLGGQTETRHEYTHPSGRAHVNIDCETNTHVYEGGLDKRSSLDSIQQALFFSYLTGKKPAVVIYNTDGKIGRFEYRIKTAAALAGVVFVSYP